MTDPETLHRAATMAQHGSSTADIVAALRISKTHARLAQRIAARRDDDDIMIEVEARFAASGMSKYQLAKITGIGESTIGRYISGENAPTTPAASRMLRALKIVQSLVNN